MRTIHMVAPPLRMPPSRPMPPAESDADPKSDEGDGLPKGDGRSEPNQAPADRTAHDGADNHDTGRAIIDETEDEKIGRRAEVDHRAQCALHRDASVQINRSQKGKR